MTEAWETKIHLQLSNSRIFVHDSAAFPATKSLTHSTSGFLYWCHFSRRKAGIIHCFRSQCTDIWKAIPVFVCINVPWCEILKRKTPWSVYVHVRVLHYGGRRRFITCSFLGALRRTLRPLRVSALKPSSLVAADTPSASYQTTVIRRLILYTTLIPSCATVKTIINSK